MAIKFNVVEKPQPGVVGGGVKKWYASVNLQKAAQVFKPKKQDR